MKKRIIAVVLVMVLTCALLTACGGKQDLSGSKYLGTWKAVSMSIVDETGEFEDDIYLVLNPDGTAQMTSEDEVSNCTWSETGNGFKLRGDAKMTFKDTGDGAVTSKVIGVELRFEKQ